MGWFTNRSYKPNQKFPQYVTYKTGTSSGDIENTTILRMDRPITKADVPAIEKHIMKQHKTGWAKVIKLGL